MVYLKQLILSRPYAERVPDDGLIAGQNGSRYERIVATRGIGYLMAYTYTGRPFEIRMGRISGKQVRASWYSPRDGKSVQIGTFPNEGVKSFTPPDKSDWVLVIDNAARR